LTEQGKGGDRQATNTIRRVINERFFFFLFYNIFFLIFFKKYFEHTTLDKHGVFSNVHQKGVGRPTSNGLDDRRWGTMFRKRGGTSGPHRMPADVIVEKTMKTGHEKLPSWNGT